MLSFILPLFALITPVTSMETVKPYFETATCDTLAIFDIDLVLVQPSEPAFQMKNIEHHRESARQIARSLTEEELDLFLSLMAVTTDSILIEDNTPTFVNDLQARGIPTIALTANLTGSLNEIPSLEQWKIGRLNALGIDFTRSAPYKERLTFYNLPSYRGYYSLYTNGVLFANGPPKGDVLVTFLKEANFSPKRIVFIDDREHNLKSVEKALQEHNPEIEYDGILYQGAKNYPSKPISQEEFEAKWKALALEAKKST